MEKAPDLYIKENANLLTCIVYSDTSRAKTLAE